MVIGDWYLNFAVRGLVKEDGGQGGYRWVEGAVDGDGDGEVSGLCIC